ALAHPPQRGARDSGHARRGGGLRPDPRRVLGLRRGLGMGDRARQRRRRGRLEQPPGRHLPPHPDRHALVPFRFLDRPHPMRQSGPDCCTREEDALASAPPSFQPLILTLHHYWSGRGCLILQPYDMEMGAVTFHPATTLRALGPHSRTAHTVQPCRRPTDGRYGENPNRLQHYYQYQVVLKPSPPDLQELYLGSLEAIGIDFSAHDIRFVEDDWESPTLGAWGLGWEVWCDGMEVTQFTYFQQMGGFDCKPVAGELTYGLERLAMYIQNKDNVFDLDFNRPPASGSEAVGHIKPVTYG